MQRLSELINNSGKQQNEISNDLGLYKQKLSRWKTGYTEPNLDDLIMLANYFEVSTDYLLGLEDETGTKIKPNK
ncbi:MAG: helix-turn-helix domain-containing protein [Clostridia bacterium]|nr:helix-turn-helix domain-containing protein [Clostridia bacterium]